MTKDQQISNHFKAQCEKRKWPQKEVAERTGWSQPEVSIYFHGGRRWHTERLNKASRALGMKISSFLEGAGL